MVVEVALAHFVNPQPSAENPARQSFDDLHARFGSLERNLRTIAETVALHARYHLAVMLPLPQQQQLEACQLGDERFKVLAEQVDQRVREGRPLHRRRLIVSTRQALAKRSRQSAKIGDPVPGPARIDPDAGSQGKVNVEHEATAAAGEGGSNSNFRLLPNSFCWPA